ncbi:MAG: thermonuclease family protein [Sneathiella sp.]|nr:thermonuclease family protein [Sneathiella sp.]
MTLRIFIALLAGLFAMPAFAEEATGYATVLGADRVDIAGKSFRLYGIVTPRLGHVCKNKSGKNFDCGAIAVTALKDLTAGAVVHCKHMKPSTVQDTPARCLAAGYDLSKGMVYTGWAIPKTKEYSLLMKNMEKAKLRKHGLWAGAFSLSGVSYSGSK